MPNLSNCAVMAEWRGGRKGKCRRIGCKERGAADKGGLIETCWPLDKSGDLHPDRRRQQGWQSGLGWGLDVISVSPRADNKIHGHRLGCSRRHSGEEQRVCRRLQK